MGLLDGRIVIITGAGRGIGREHALYMASQGASVIVNDLGGDLNGVGDTRAAAQIVVDEIVAGGGKFIFTDHLALLCHFQTNTIQKILSFPSCFYLAGFGLLTNHSPK